MILVPGCTIEIENSLSLKDSIRYYDNYTVNNSDENQDDGYPWPDDHWSDKFRIAELDIISENVPMVVELDEDINVSYEARIDEDYPKDVTRNVTEEDNATANVKLVYEKYNLVVADKKADLENSTFKASFSTDGLISGSFNVIFNGSIPKQAGCVRSNLTVNIVDKFEDFDVEKFEVTPDSVNIDGKISVNAKIKNKGEHDKTIEVLINEILVDRFDLGKGESVEIDKSYELKELGIDSIGEYSIFLNATDKEGNEEILHKTVKVEKVERDPVKYKPWLIFTTCTIGIFLLVLYRWKKN